MYGYYGLAAALFTTVALLASGASDSLMQNVEEKTTPGESRESFATEELVEGHTTFVTIGIGEETFEPTRPTEKTIHCTETNPTDPVWPIFESCSVDVGPISGVGPVDDIERIHADVHVENRGLPVIGNPDEGFWDMLFSFIPGL